MSENAKKDLKEGLLLYNTENNVGLKNAWNIIQAEVRLGSTGQAGSRGGSGSTQLTKLGTGASWILTKSCWVRHQAVGCS